LKLVVVGSKAVAVANIVHFGCGVHIARCANLVTNLTCSNSIAVADHLRTVLWQA